MAAYALLCPGQGAQSPRMLDFALASPAGREAVAEASDVAGLDIASRVRAGDDLFEPVFAQLCIVATTVASWQALAGEVPEPALVAGYSVGEVSAWCCAGSWNIGEAMAAVGRRAQLMAQASPPDAAMMAVTALRRDTLLAITSRHALHVAIEVDSDHHIVAGRRPGLEAAAPQLEAAGASLHRLPVGVPSHTPLLDAAADALPAALASIAGRNPRIPVLRGIDGKALFAYADAIPAIARAVARPIRWKACIEEARERGIEATVELPPGNALTRMLARHPGLQARAVADFRSAEGVARWMERLA